MLSAETAAGKYPVQAVKMMDYVARNVEALQWAESKFGALMEHDDAQPPIPIHVAMARSTAQLARDLAVRTIVVISRTGATATIMSDARPSAPILAIATDAGICRRMNLLWGVVPVQITDAQFQQPGPVASQLARSMGLADAGQFALMISGVSSFSAGAIPTVAVLKT
jgi:pyruvate kinase